MVFSNKLVHTAVLHAQQSGKRDKFAAVDRETPTVVASGLACCYVDGGSRSQRRDDRAEEEGTSTVWFDSNPGFSRKQRLVVTTPAKVRTLEITGVTDYQDRGTNVAVACKEVVT